MRKKRALNPLLLDFFCPCPVGNESCGSTACYILECLAGFRAGFIYRAVLSLAPSQHPSVWSVHGGKLY